MKRTVELVVVLILVLCVGCQSGSSTSVGVLTPVVEYSITEGMNRGSQTSAIAFGATGEWFATELTRDELLEIARRHGGKFPEPWMYMGTENHRHYFALYRFLGSRGIYAIHEDHWKVEEPFALTSRTSSWREVRIISDEPMRQNLVKMPLFARATPGRPATDEQE